MKYADEIKTFADFVESSTFSFWTTASMHSVVYMQFRKVYIHVEEA